MIEKITALIKDWILHKRKGSVTINFSDKGRTSSVQINTTRLLDYRETLMLLDDWVDKKKVGSVSINFFKGGVSSVQIIQIKETVIYEKGK